MKRFDFRLGRVRRVRALQEVVERERWMEAEARCAEAEAELARWVEATRNARMDLRDLVGSPTIGVRRVLLGQEQLRGLEQGCTRVRERVRTLRDQADRLREPWQERRRELAGLERLEERAREAWRQEERSEDTRQMNELASSRAARASAPKMGAQGASPGSRSMDLGPPTRP